MERDNQTESENTSEWTYQKDGWVYNPLEEATSYINGSTNIDQQEIQPSIFPKISTHTPKETIEPTEVVHGIKDVSEIDRSWIKHQQDSTPNTDPTALTPAHEPSLRTIVDNTDFVIPQERLWVKKDTNYDTYDPQSYGLPVCDLEFSAHHEPLKLDGILNTDNLDQEQNTEQASDLSDELPLI